MDNYPPEFGPLNDYGTGVFDRDDDKKCGCCDCENS